jgi:hypothetical protein
MAQWMISPLAQVPPNAAAVYGRADSSDVAWLSHEPANEDTPAVLLNGAVVASAAVGDTLTCTKGNWVGAPTSYTYQWKSGGTNAGANSDTYVVVAGDSGKTIVCVVTATNASGSTAAPPSNGVHIA